MGLGYRWPIGFHSRARRWASAICSGLILASTLSRLSWPRACPWSAARRNFESAKMTFWDALYDTGWRYPPIQDEQDVETPASSQIPSSNPQ